MATQDVKSALVRQGQSEPTASPVADHAAIIPSQPGATPDPASPRAGVTRRRHRVNFRQRYESRGVDTYRQQAEATEQDDGETTLDVLT